MYTPVNPVLLCKRGLRGSKLYRYVFVMHTALPFYTCETNFVTFCLLLCIPSLAKKGLFKKESLLPGEKILSFYGKSLFIRDQTILTKLSTLKVYRFPFRHEVVYPESVMISLLSNFSSTLKPLHLSIMAACLSRLISINAHQP